MEEKIKVNLPQIVYNILIKDMEMFEFYKKDRTLNRNSFLNTLIMNYYETYESRNRYLKDMIKESIESYTSLSSNDLNQLGNTILNKVNSISNELEFQRFNQQIVFRPTKNSRRTVDYIQNFLLNDSSLSNYFRVLFTSYSKLAQDQREKIIFKHQFEVIQTAIDQQKMLYIKTSKEKKHLISPYSIASSKEELFNYLLATSKNRVFTFRISRIADILILNEQSQFELEHIETFNKMIQFGPQYIYHNNAMEDIVVQLSKLGIQFFEQMYIHRPIPRKIENDLYYFDCSLDQVTHYFKRFGSTALILSPIHASLQLKEFYEFGYQRYQEYYLSQSSNEDSD